METAVEIMMASISIVVWCAAAWQFFTGRLMLKPRSKVTVPWNSWDVFSALLVYFIFGITAAQIAMHFAHVEPGTITADLTAEQLAAIQLADSIAKILFLCVTIGMLVVHCRATPRDLGIQWSHVPRDIVIGVLAFFFIVPAVLAVKLLLSQWLDFGSHPIEELLSDPDNGKLLAIAMFVAVVVAPIAEEFFFRLLLQGWFENLVENIRPDSRHSSEANPNGCQQLGDESPQEDIIVNTGIQGFYWRSLPVVGSSLLFALLHQGYDRIPLFLFALGLGYLFQHTGRLLPCILVHFMLNALSVVIIFLLS